MIAITMLIVILMMVTVALTQLIPSFVMNVGAMLTIAHMFQVRSQVKTFFGMKYVINFGLIILIFSCLKMN